jgi:8-oxo-dGTP pyrophosphatase MutT (NUDIX family)
MHAGDHPTSLMRRLAALERRLGRPLPGEAAHQRLSISERPILPLTDVLRRRELRIAAVLVALFPDEVGLTRVVLTRRRAELRDHAGQISFPGGRMEAEESPEEAALREGWEELALQPETVRVLGRLSPLWIPPSDFLIYPVVGALDSRPQWTVQDSEVAAVIEAPLEHFMDRGNIHREWWDLRGERRLVPHYRVDEHQVWGATAMVLAELAELWSEAEQG